MNKPLIQSDKKESAIERSAIRADYKKNKESSSAKDLADYLDKCYTNYLEYSQDLSLPKDVRISYLDQATSFKKILDYINRQAK